jgi:hypothetical protein
MPTAGLAATAESGFASLSEAVASNTANAISILPQTEAFYGRSMDDLRIDPDVEKNRYFEMSGERAVRFMKGGDT